MVNEGLLFATREKFLFQGIPRIAALCCMQRFDIIDIIKELKGNFAALFLSILVNLSKAR